MKEVNIAYIRNDENIQLTINFVKLVLSKPNSYLKISREINGEKIKNIINNGQVVNCIFSSHFLPSENIKIIFKEFDIGSFYESIDFFVADTYDDLKRLSTEPYDKENSWKIKDILIKNCYIFENNRPKDLIWFFAKIFFDILTEHKLINGNKRVATMMLYKLCYNYGFFVNNSIGKSWRNNEDKIVGFIEHYQNTHLAENVQNEIYKWVIDNLCIANNFHIEKDE